MSASPVIAAFAAAALAALTALAPGPAGAAEAPPAAPAAAPASQGFTLSVRGGWAAPYGDFAGGQVRAPLDETLRWMVPLGLGVGYRLNRRFLVDLFIEYAKVELERDCKTGCDASSVRFGADMQLQLAPGHRLAPWLGLGAAVEFLELDLVGFYGDDLGEVSFAGVALLVEAGADVVLTPRFRIGPYVALSPAVFTSTEVDGPPLAPAGPQRIDDRAVHAWLQVGVKITLDL